MNHVFGIDGCKSGWIVAEKKIENELNITFIKSLDQLEKLIRKEAIDRKSVV